MKLTDIKLMSETSIYKYIDTVKGSKFTDKIKDFVSDKNTITLTESSMEDVFYKIRHKSFDYPAKFAVLSLFKKGVIQLMYNESHKLPTAVPYFRRKLSGGGYGIIINLSNFANMKDGSLSNMDPYILYTLMLTGTFSLVINEYSSLVSMNGIPELYGRMFATTAAKLVNMDQQTKAKMQFIGTKFMYVQLGNDEAGITDRAAVSIVAYMDKMIVKQIDAMLSSGSYNNLEALIGEIKTNISGMSKMEYYTFFDRWIRAYGELSAFSIEYVPFFVTVVMALVTNCNSMINIAAIEKEAAKNDVKELAKFIENMENVIINLDKRA